MRSTILLIGLIATVFSGCASQQHGQVPDKSYLPAVESPAYRKGSGPVLCLDEAHFNFHTLDGRFWAFGSLARRDGFKVRALRDSFDERSLDKCDLLVISNAQPSDEEWSTYPYPTPSAFTPDEVSVTREWVEAGGSLLLIADHMPLAGAAADLAVAFDVNFNDGFAVSGFDNHADLQSAFARETIFRVSDGTLRSHAIVRGRNPQESVTKVRSFVGQAFQVPSSAQLILVVPNDFISLMPEKAWQFSPETKKVPVGGWAQGAVMTVGKGRAAFFGEAAMFSAQLGNGMPMGMNAPGAEENYKLVLNLLRWLSGALAES